MSGSLTHRFSTASEFQMEHLSSFSECVYTLYQGGNFFKAHFWISLSYFTERKKAQRTLGFFTNGGLKLHTCLCDESKDSSINGATAIHTVSGKELKKKKKCQERLIVLEAKYRSIIQTLEAAQRLLTKRCWTQLPSQVLCPFSAKLCPPPFFLKWNHLTRLASGKKLIPDPVHSQVKEDNKCEMKLISILSTHASKTQGAH